MDWPSSLRFMPCFFSDGRIRHGSPALIGCGERGAERRAEALESARRGPRGLGAACRGEGCSGLGPSSGGRGQGAGGRGRAVGGGGGRPGVGEEGGGGRRQWWGGAGVPGARRGPSAGRARGLVGGVTDHRCPRSGKGDSRRKSLSGVLARVFEPSGVPGRRPSRLSPLRLERGSAAAGPVWVKAAVQGQVG